MKNKVIKVIAPTVRFILNTLLSIWHIFLNLKNFNRPKIFIYTDSRGYNVLNKWGKIYFDTYIGSLISKYRVKYFICPEKYTTIVDFLNTIEKYDTSKYQSIILHCGVVDFSPRPTSNIAAVKASKTGNIKFNDLFIKNRHYYENPYDVLYKNEPTINLYSPEFLENDLIPRLKALKNLVWINSNHFVKDWDGNFTKGRPTNIDSLVSKFDYIVASKVTKFIDLKVWSDDEIKTFTIDNIHFTKKGFKEIINKIENAIESNS